jgi:uncharacterized protein YjiS (DUF1127 family)
MSVLSTNTSTDAREPSDLRKGLSKLATSIGRGFAAYAERRTRTGEINRLNAMTDAELAEIGLKREQITYHVFRDLFYI